MGEFNVDKTTGGLEQTAGMPSEYPATQVMMSDGVTSVEDALDGLTGKHAVSNTTSSLTKDTEFECPSDGYLFIFYNTNCLVSLKTKDVTGTNNIIIRQNLTASGSSVFPLFVRKGMIMTWLNESTNTSVTYRAVVSN